MVLDDLRTRWATVASVQLNNSLSENWIPLPDTRDQWSHCPVAPLYVLSQDIAGIRATSPGFATCHITPQLGDLPSLSVTVHTPHGPLGFRAELTPDVHLVHLDIPAGIAAELHGAPLPNGKSQHHVKRYAPRYLSAPITSCSAC